MSTQFNCQKHFHFKIFNLFKQLYITIQLSVGTVSISKTVTFQIIQFSISMPLVLFNPRIGPYQVLHAGPEWTWEQLQWRGAPYSPRSQHYWDLTIRLFSVISGYSLEVGSYPSAEVQSVYYTALADKVRGHFWSGRGKNINMWTREQES